MASITINSTNIIQACDKCKKYWDEKERVYVHSVDTPYIEALHGIKRIRDIAEFSERFGLYSISIDHNDFALIGEYLTLPRQGKE